MRTLDKKNQNDMSALMLASREGHSSIVSSLIKVGDSVDLRNKYGKTALKFVCKNDQFRAVLTLLKLEANIYTYTSVNGVNPIAVDICFAKTNTYFAALHNAAMETVYKH